MPRSSNPGVARLRRLAYAALAALLAGAVAVDAEARALRSHTVLAQASPTVSADAAAERVRAESGGRILDVRLEHGPRGPVYRVKVLLEGGRVRIYRVDANSGRILQ